MYDNESEMNIDNLKAWLHQVEKYAFGDAIRVIIRNKIDLYEHGGVSTEEVQVLSFISFFSFLFLFSHKKRRAWQTI